MRPATFLCAMLLMAVLPFCFQSALAFAPVGGASVRVSSKGWGCRPHGTDPLAAAGHHCRPLRGLADRRGARPSTSAAAVGSGTGAVGGARTEASLTALVAGMSVGLLCAIGQCTQKSFGLPLWAPPLGAVSLIFASEATAAARDGKIMAPAAIWQRALKAGSTVAGACIVAVLVTRVLGPSPLGRAVAVATASLWMTAFPMSGYFPPTGAFCALYVDQAIGAGALAKLGLKYALFPCGAGTVLLLVFTRLIAGVLARPLRAVQKSKQAAAA
uniref:Uncharacterized protein n=1 Tax=Alexandrium monilatum TaxID=311494 RepID=A0A7S4UG19_9DINO